MPSDSFALRFVIGGGRPTLADVAPLWPALTCERDDGVLILRSDDRVLARVDLLLADESRGRSVLAALRRNVPDVGEGAEAVGFVIDGATGVVVASPQATDEPELEESLSALDTLWQHLFEAHGGVLQIDGEGIYGDEGMLVEAP